MGNFFYIILISFVCLTINSCAEIERSSESANFSLKEQIWFSAYDILFGTALMSSDNLFAPEQASNEKGVNSTPKNNNIFLVKQNSFGSREWIMDLGISDEESGISMTFDSSDNVYITGYTRNGLEGNKNSGDFTVFLVKYNSSGTKDWIKKLGKSEVEYGARLIVDSSDNIYVTGFSSEFEFRNTLMAKYDTSGNREWTKALGSTLNDFAWDVTVDSNDNIYVTGFSENSFAQNSSWQDDILLMKFNTDGIKL
ncbi:SBBP repeat-containing protein [Deltaproteobacteria bacterium]|nr:SBBP repeat-containing protein [Deltaproteobacteria bacterium]